MTSHLPVGRGSFALSMAILATGCGVGGDSVSGAGGDKAWRVAWANSPSGGVTISQWAEHPSSDGQSSPADATYRLIVRPTIAGDALDDGDLVQYLVDQAEIDFTPAGLTSGDHDALFVVRDVNEHAERWTPPFQSILQLEGFVIGGAMRPAPAAKSLRMEFYGDSITQGVLSECGYADIQAATDYVNGQANNKCSDGTHDYAYLVARAFR